MKPRDLAAVISDHLEVGSGFLLKTEIAGPGFINFFLAPNVWQNVLHTIHKVKDDYGSSVQAGSPRILLEFVSANPTGPLHVGHGERRGCGRYSGPIAENLRVRTLTRNTMSMIPAIR